MAAELFPDSPAAVVRVALPIPEDRLFDYAVPETLRSGAEAGRRVMVPFGPKRRVGVIVEGATAPSANAVGKLRPLERILDSEPVLSTEMLEALRAEARDVLCPIGLALQAALPSGSAPRPLQAHTLSPRGREALQRGAAAKQLVPLLLTLDGQVQTAAQLRRQDARWPGWLKRLEREGLVQTVDLEAPGARAATTRFAAVAAGIDVEAACGESLSRSPRQAELLRHLAEHGPCSLPSLREPFPTATQLLHSLEARGLVELEARPALGLGDAPAPDAAVELTEEQAEALAVIEQAMQQQRAQTYLLHGVTGSGKTEVYLRAIARALEAERQALVLVPEITLTHQIVSRLRARFGDQVAVLHSGLRPGERIAHWQRLRRGTTPIAVGARSAVFAPLDRLGLVVIDEEHDSAYKNEEGFHYHARSFAARRAAQAHCPLVLGTATPSLETRYAADHDSVERLVLSRRIGSRPLPAVELVDLAEERAKAPRGRKLVLSGPLRRAMRGALADEGQVILFLNRRGFSTQVMCFECGFAERCKNCDITLVFHVADHQLRCHYCDYHQPPSDTCSQCGAPDTALLGIGTERLEEEVRAEFPDARVARLDRDTAARRGATAAILRDLSQRKLDVLIGTQMVAKGHDYPGVSLVGIVAADLSLHLPDFRAAERTFQLLTQVAGRAGRGTQPGRVLIQTFVPEHYALRPVRKHDYETFYAEELEHRAALGYPPFGQLAYAVVSGPDEADTRQATFDLVTDLRDASDDAVEILGPAAAPLARLRGRYRFQILVKGKQSDAVHTAAGKLAELATRLRGKLQASVDVNPINML